MNEVEVGFKIKNSLEESRKILIDNGFENIFNTQTHDLYFSNKKPNKNMTEQEIKFSCVRFRHTKGKCRFENFKLFDKTKDDKFECLLDEAGEIFIKLKSAGFNKVFDTYKSDNIFRKGTLCCQLQDINGIGLLNYIFDEDVFHLSQKEQFEYLTKQMLDMGFILEYEKGVDKFRSFINGKLMFSKNQNGDYNAK